MPDHIDIIGVALLAMFIVGTQLISVVRTVKSVKSHAHLLLQLRDDAVQKGKYSIHYDKAHTVMYGLQREKLDAIRHTFFGAVVARVLSESFYEIPQT
ncbi:hypothetical protein KBB12_02250 [Candidatus Woesebacteria bacterium]|nr:hypothetical protein [Candidatus Woesebacteria bacterium]